jgi:hypothetical protein
MRANTNASRTTIFLWLSLVLSPAAFGDAGHPAAGAPAAPDGRRGATGDHSTAPAPLADRVSLLPGDKA